jgi:hypothetical protein
MRAYSRASLAFRADHVPGIIKAELRLTRTTSPPRRRSPTPFTLNAQIRTQPRHALMLGT